MLVNWWDGYDLVKKIIDCNSLKQICIKSSIHHINQNDSFLNKIYFILFYLNILSEVFTKFDILKCLIIYLFKVHVRILMD